MDFTMPEVNTAGFEDDCELCPSCGSGDVVHSDSYCYYCRECGYFWDSRPLNIDTDAIKGQ